jgi:alkanesulfonate monooxygenase SsuD/methylene tetrahydromethanopterin reductase-like flavin-dependent oxidoreductase (luciferase family)
MKFGVFYQMPCAEHQQPAVRYQETIAQVQLADQLGFDSAWLAELHFNSRFSVMSAPMMVASAIAQTTIRIKIGTAVHLMPLHHPIRLAEEAATLDVLSGGRSIFGIGRGAIPTHFQGYGIDQEQARDRFLEGLEMVLGMWTQEEFSYRGQYYQADALSVEPRPLQQPHPPVYIAANSPDTFGIVGELGHNILVAPTIVTAQGAVDGLALYRSQLAENGHDENELAVNVTAHVHVADSEAEARAGFESTINNYLGTLRDMGGSGRGSARAHALDYQTVRDEFAAVGTPEQVAEKLQLFQSRYGPQGFICWFNTGGMLPHEAVTNSMRLFAEEVMPRFQG